MPQPDNKSTAAHEPWAKCVVQAQHASKKDEEPTGTNRVMKCVAWSPDNKCLRTELSAASGLKLQPVYSDPNPSDCRKAEAPTAWILKGEDKDRLFQLSIICHQLPRLAASVIDVIEHNPSVVNYVWDSTVTTLKRHMSEDEAEYRLKTYIANELKFRGETDLMPDFQQLKKFSADRAKAVKKEKEENEQREIIRRRRADELAKTIPVPDNYGYINPEFEKAFRACIRTMGVDSPDKIAGAVAACNTVAPNFPPYSPPMPWDRSPGLGVPR